MPAAHEVTAKLPAVSGSSGRLVVARVSEGGDERQWPGQVFENPALSYEEAMVEFTTASRERGQREGEQTERAKAASLSAQKRALRREEEALRNERRRIRERRKLEDAAWKEARAARKAEEEAYWALPKEERRKQRKAKRRQDEEWRAMRARRRAILEERKREDAEWRRKRLDLRQRKSELPVVTHWIAILVMVDNCTRQCLGLPLFVAGPKVTSEMVVEALRDLLPPELQFLISDRGVHFTAQAFQKLARSEGFIHVPVARHRPQSNGIAERFVRTLKEWLADKSWENEQTLQALLEQFLDEYNNRPHQGLAIPGLSPNEFAGRIWLM